MCAVRLAASQCFGILLGNGMDRVGHLLAGQCPAFHGFAFAGTTLFDEGDDGEKSGCIGIGIAGGEFWRGESETEQNGCLD